MKGHSLNAYRVNHQEQPPFLCSLSHLSCSMFEEFSKIVTGLVLEQLDFHNGQAIFTQCAALTQQQGDAQLSWT